MVQRINKDYLKFKLKKASDYLITLGMEPMLVEFYGSRQESFMEAIAVLDKVNYTRLQSRLMSRVMSATVIQYSAHFVIDCNTGEWIKERCPLPLTEAEIVLYGKQ